MSALNCVRTVQGPRGSKSVRRGPYDICVKQQRKQVASSQAPCFPPQATQAQHCAVVPCHTYCSL